METGKVICPECGGNHFSAEHDNIKAQHQRLESAVVSAAKEERRLEHIADEGRNTIVRTDALINSSRAARVRREAVDALIAFEAEHKIGEK
jgi:predicted  nucleic acid-binding Zn-ribbon protein